MWVAPVTYLSNEHLSSHELAFHEPRGLHAHWHFSRNIFHLCCIVLLHSPEPYMAAFSNEARHHCWGMWPYEPLILSYSHSDVSRCLPDDSPSCLQMLPYASKMFPRCFQMPPRCFLHDDFFGMFHDVFLKNCCLGSYACVIYVTHLQYTQFSSCI